MKWIIAAAVVVMLLGGCKQEDAARSNGMDRIERMKRMERGNLTKGELQQIASTFPGMTDACLRKVQKKGINTFADRTEQCFHMTPRQRWRGVWRSNFEGQSFCPAPARDCIDDPPGGDIWLTFSEQLPHSKMQSIGGLYEIEFIGRKTVHPGRFGHFGMFDHEMVVERVISLRELEPPPMSKADMEKWEKDCKASKICWTNKELEPLGLKVD